MFISTTHFQLFSQEPKNFIQKWDEFAFAKLVPGLKTKQINLYQSLLEEKSFRAQVEFFDRNSMEQWNAESWTKITSPLEVQKTEASDVSAWELRASWTPGKSDYRSAYMDELVGRLYAEESEEQKRIKSYCQEKGLPPIQVPASDGRLMEILVQMQGAQRGVEVGTLGGYSASWLLKGLRGAGQDSYKLYSLELEESRAQVARHNLKQCGYREDEFEIIVGDAHAQLQEHSKEWSGVDFVFIDADKASYPKYLNWALAHLRVGGMVLIDNSYLWGGMNFVESKEAPESLSHEWGRFDTPTRAQFLGMQQTWQILQDAPNLKSLQISTGEGLSIALKTA